MPMSDAPLLANVDALIDGFSRTDARMPTIVFGMLAHFRAGGPFPFEADRIAAQLNRNQHNSPLNAASIAQLQGDIEVFFAPGAEGLAPRPEIFGTH